jgi:hypothetical protein
MTEREGEREIRETDGRTDRQTKKRGNDKQKISSFSGENVMLQLEQIKYIIFH